MQYYLNLCCTLMLLPLTSPISPRVRCAYLNFFIVIWHICLSIVFISITWNYIHCVFLTSLFCTQHCFDSFFLMSISLLYNIYNMDTDIKSWWTFELFVKVTCKHPNVSWSNIKGFVYTILNSGMLNYESLMWLSKVNYFIKRL